MDLKNPELADRLAAAHALGTLRGGARRRFEALARQSPALRARALLWQERIAAMNELQPPRPPDPQVWKRIAIALRQEEEAQARRVRPPARPWWGWALAGGLAAVLAFTVPAYLAQRGGAGPTHVAVLQDQAAAPQLLVTYDARQDAITVRRVGGFREQADRSLELWALPPGGAPRSLGVLAPGAVARLPAPAAAVRGVPALAVSLEPRGGAPAGSGPTGPVLFQGPLVPAT